MTTPDELIAAIKAGDAGQVSALLDAAPELLGAKGPNGVSWLMLAVYHGKQEIARMFVDRGMVLDVFDATAIGAAERVKEAIAADPALANGTSADGFHPLGLACYFGQEAIARLLVEAGADVHVASSNTMKVQPIHAAAARRSAALVSFLLERGADPNARQHMGFVALHSAAQNGDSATAEALLAAGADAALRSDDGKNAADFAAAAGHVALAERLRPAGAQAGG